MFVFWKYNGEMICQDTGRYDLKNLSPEQFRHLLGCVYCQDAPVSAETLLEYLATCQRDDIFAEISLDELIHLAYTPSCRNTGLLSGAEYLQRDKMHCTQEQLLLLRKILPFKEKLAENNKNAILAETSLFEICRRNDPELLHLYLDEFNGPCPPEIYDAIFDYYIYMFLPDWNLLNRHNRDLGYFFQVGDLPGVLYNETEIVSKDVQQKLLNILIQQAEQCKAPPPQALEILFRHNVPSGRSAFPTAEQSVQLGVEFSSRDIYNTKYAARILFHYDDRELDPTNCIDPWELDNLLTDSCCAIPVTSSANDYGSGGIRAVAESLVIGNRVRLYIPICEETYFFDIADRTALRKELLLMLKHTICILELHKNWQKTGIAPEDDENEEYAAFLPYRTTLADLQKLCEAITVDLTKEKRNYEKA